MEELDIPRDRWSRPLILQDSGKPVPYTRTSTFASAVDDKSGLIKWSAAQAVRGLIERPDLFEVARTRAKDDAFIKEISNKATEAAASDRAANLGTSIHFWTEQHDRGQISMEGVVPAEYDSLMAAYIEATKEFEMVDAEVFCVCDDLNVAGTLDRLIRLPDGRVVVGDLKTGKSTPSFPLSTCVQTSVYAHSKRYDPETGIRTPLHPDLDDSITLLIHAPLPETGKPPTVTIYELDAVAGWHGARLARLVMDWRKSKPIKKFEAGVALTPAI